MTTKIHITLDASCTLRPDPCRSLPYSLVAALTDKYTLDNPVYLNALQFSKTGKVSRNIHPTLRFYTEKDGDLILPRGDWREILGTTIEGGNPVNSLSDFRLSLPEENFRFKGELRPYQQQAVGDLLRQDMGVLRAATGAGKTVIALGMIAARQQPCLILVHTKELLYQWQDRIKTFLDVEPGIVGDGKFWLQPVTIAMVQTARKRIRDLADKFSYIIVDEAHRTPSKTFTEILSQCPAKYVTGLTATPYRSDGLDDVIGWYCGAHRVEVDPRQLRDIGAVLEPEVIWNQTQFEYPYKDDYTKMISALAADESRNELIAKVINQAAARKETVLVTSDRVAHLQNLAERINPTHTHRILTGSLRKTARTEIVKDLAAGKVQILLSTLSLISEGFDAPGLSSLVLAAPVKYEGRLIQVVGRILRPAPGKTPRIYDFNDRKQPILRHQARHRQTTYSKLKNYDNKEGYDTWT